jgi:hypothetical protein
MKKLKIAIDLMNTGKLLRQTGTHRRWGQLTEVWGQVTEVWSQVTEVWGPATPSFRYLDQVNTVEWTKTKQHLSY